MAQFTEQQVLKIRNAASNGIDYTKLAEKFDCTSAVISRVALGTAYKQFDGPLTQKRTRKKKTVTKVTKIGTGKRAFTDEQVIWIREQIATGVSAPNLAKKFRVLSQSISSVARGATYPEVGGPLTSKKKKKPGPDLAALSIDDAARFLQAISVEWPKIRDAFAALDRLIGDLS